MILRHELEALLKYTFENIYEDVYVRHITVDPDPKGDDYRVSAEVRLLVFQSFTEAELLDNRGVERIEMIKKKFLAACRKELKKSLNAVFAQPKMNFNSHESEAVNEQT